MRQQLKYLQAELCARTGGVPTEEVRVCLSLLIDSSSIHENAF